MYVYEYELISFIKKIQILTSPILLEEKIMKVQTFNCQNTNTCLYVVINKFLHLRWLLGSFSEVNHSLDMWSPTLLWQCFDNHYDYAWVFHVPVERFIQTPWTFGHKQSIIVNNHMYIVQVWQGLNLMQFCMGPTLRAMTRHINQWYQSQFLLGIG